MNRTRMTSLYATLFSVAVMGCGGGGIGEMECNPGESRSCDCCGTGTCLPSNQQCLPDGSWGACLCSDTDGGTFEPVCEGIPTACTGRADAECGPETGCTLGVCGGRPRSGFCSAQGIGQCFEPFCDWNSEFGFCSSGNTDCDTLRNQDACRLTGCTWATAGTCAGAPRPCAGISDRDACVAQPGCEAICPGAQTWCNGACTDTATSNAHCGACNAACGTGTQCEAGVCECATPSCGSCGTVCAPEQACTAGQCSEPTASVLWVLSILQIPEVQFNGSVAGFNLDNLVSSTPDTAGCQRVDATSPEGALGIDNEVARLVRLVDPLLESAFGVTVGGVLEQTFFDGGLLLGVLFSPNGATYDVSIVQLEPTTSIQFDSIGIAADQTWVVSSPLVTITGMPAVQGRIVLRDFELDIPLNGVPGNPSLSVSSGVLLLDVGGSAGEGMLGGGADPSLLTDAVPELSGFLNPDLRDGSETCNRISVGLLARFVPGTIAVNNAPACGDGVLDLNEDCDDGNVDNGDACPSNCLLGVCGDGILSAIEVCDDGNLDNSDGCLSTCAFASCGDGFVRTGVEDCEDGNLDSGDSCVACSNAVCGDGHVRIGVESCDDGNVHEWDACGSACVPGTCGDGVVQRPLFESCDDGATVPGDGCDAECHVEPFTSTSPVRLSGSLACGTPVANAARKIAVDGNGTIFAVMKCGAEAYVVVSRDRGVSFSTPLRLSVSGEFVHEVAVSSGASGVGYVAVMVDDGSVYLRTTVDYGGTWSDPNLIGRATSTSAGLSLQSFNDNVYVGFAEPSGVTVARSAARGLGVFGITFVPILIEEHFDLLVDESDGRLVVAAASPAFGVRVSLDGGVTFRPEANPAGAQFSADWALGSGTLFAVGTGRSGRGNPTLIYSIPTEVPTMSSSFAGLPAVNTNHARTVAADTAFTAYVVSRLDNGVIQLDRRNRISGRFDAPRILTLSGESPIVAPLPGASGAAVVYTVGTEVFATIQTY